MKDERLPGTIAIALAVLLSTAAIGTVTFYGLMLAVRLIGSVPSLHAASGYSHVVR